MKHIATLSALATSLVATITMAQAPEVIRRTDIAGESAPDPHDGDRLSRGRVLVLHPVHAVILSIKRWTKEWSLPRFAWRRQLLAVEGWGFLVSWVSLLFYRLC